MVVKSTLVRRHSPTKLMFSIGALSSSLEHEDRIRPKIRALTRTKFFIRFAFLNFVQIYGLFRLRINKTQLNTKIINIMMSNFVGNYLQNCNNLSELPAKFNS